MRKVPLLILLVLLISCNKKYHVIGRVYNPITGEGLANVKVEFFRSTVGEIPAGNEEITSTLTDANGYYDLAYKGRAENIKLELDGSLYELGNFYNGSYQTVRGLEAKKTQEIDWHALPYGQIITHTENVNCSGPTDSMQVRGKTDYTPWTEFGFVYRIGCYNHTSSSPSKVPMGYRYYETKVTRSGVTTYIYDTVFVNESGTTYLDILY